MELDQAKEKLEELQLDYQLLKEEMSDKRGESDQNVPTSYEMRQLEQQNARLRDTLVRYVLTVSANIVLNVLYLVFHRLTKLILIIHI